MQVVVLPPALESHPYLQDFHGSVEFIIRGVFSHYMGWFSGNPAELHPMTESEEARNMLELADGPERLLEGIQQSIDMNEFEWALQMCEWLRLCKVEEEKTRVMGRMSKIIILKRDSKFFI